MIHVHHYTLGDREGALLEVDGGYCDVHPWPELGDLPLFKQLNLLKEGTLTPLTKQSLEFARLDAAARKKGRGLLEGVTVPQSHFLIKKLDQDTINLVHQAFDEGFRTFKVKLGKDLPKEITLIKPLLELPQTRWRLDFNGSLCQEFLNADLNFDAIEFCEDPGLDEFPLPVAWDREEVSHYQYRIVKPAVDDWRSMRTNKPLIFTTYLGHPLGQVADAYVAGVFQCKEVCGLLSHRVYAPNAFSECLSWSGPEWRSPEGTGFGFDHLLEGLSWQSLT